MICHVCKKRVRNRYVEALGHIWHPECFRCAACGLVIEEGKFLHKDGRPYHPDCYHKHFSPRCEECGEPISGQYLKVKDKVWHPEHFVCSDCGILLDSGFFERGGKIFCEEHFLERFGQRCSLCSKPMKGEYIQDFWGNKYCSSHADLPHCFSCGRVISKRISGGGIRYADERVICEICHKTAVDDDKKTAKIFKQVAAFFTKLGLKLDIKNIPVRLVGQPELDKLSAGKFNDFKSAGVTITQSITINGMESKREVKEILALYGLPEEHLAVVLAHELGHAWLFLNWYPALPAQIEEGICELCEYFWLNEQNTREAKYRLKSLEENKDRIYGTGYRKARKALKNHSFEDILIYIKENGKFPG